MESKLDIKKLIKERGTMGKYHGVAPEGFVLVHEKTLEQLKDFDIWKSWIHNETTIKEMNKINFENE